MSRGCQVAAVHISKRQYCISSTYGFRSIVMFSPHAYNDSLKLQVRSLNSGYSGASPVSARVPNVYYIFMRVVRFESTLAGLATAANIFYPSRFINKDIRVPFVFFSDILCIIFSISDLHFQRAGFLYWLGLLYLIFVFSFPIIVYFFFFFCWKWVTVFKYHQFIISDLILFSKYLN